MFQAARYLYRVIRYCKLYDICTVTVAMCCRLYDICVVAVDMCRLHDTCTVTVAMCCRLYDTHDYVLQVVPDMWLCVVGFTTLVL